MKVLLDALGVWCVIAICGNNPEKGIKYRHTWNIVRIGGTYYHLDATFDNTLGKSDKSKIFVMITLIWMTNRFSKIMSH